MAFSFVAGDFFATKIAGNFNRNKELLQPKTCVCGNEKMLKQQLICYRLNSNKNHTILTNGTNNYNNKISCVYNI
jgi:hypothetical protein